MRTKIQLSDHFNYRKLLRFTLPSILMMVFTSVYSVVDGFFVSNYVGKTPFTAVNLIMPFLMILGAFGFMFGAGGSALVSKLMGEGNREKANSCFSLLVYIAAALGVVLAVAGIFVVRPVSVLLGAEGEMLDYCVLYGRIILAALPAFMLQFLFQSFFVAAEKPQLGLVITVVSGIMNMVCDALFVALFKWGIAGAAAATVASQVVGGVVPVIYFFCPNKSLLRLGKTRFDIKAVLKSCANGSSELMSNISTSIVSMMYNAQLMKYAGADGVAAYGVLMYVNFIFLAAFIGYSVGTAPVIGFNYGAGNGGEMKGILKKSMVMISIFSVVMCALAEGLAGPLAKLYVGYDENLLSLTVRAFRFASFSFLFSGIAIFGSSFFTALNNGLVSALISFLRTLVFQIAAVMLLPLVFDVDGIWISIIVAELLAAVLSAIFILAKRKRYKY